MMMEPAPAISVILVVYNAIAYIEDAIKHLLEQRYKRYEIVVIDGGSNDGTQQVLMKYKDRLGALHIAPDKGIYDAMNKGARLAKGDYLYFIGADDRLLVDLEEVAPYLKDSNAIYYGDVWLKQQQQRYAGKFNTAKIIRKNICHQAIFYPKCVFTIYRYDISYKALGDYMFNIKLWGDKTFNFKYVPLTIAAYNQEGISATYTERKFSFLVIKAIYRHLGIRYVFLKLFNPLLNLVDK